MRDIYLCKDKNYSQKIFLKIKLKIIKAITAGNPKISEEDIVN